MTQQTGDVFKPLLDGMQLFQARVKGEDGSYRDDIVKMPDTPDVVPEVTKTVLEAVATMLEWLTQALDLINKHIITADGLLAIIEVLVQAIASIGDALDKTWPDALSKASNVADGLKEIGGLLEGSSFELPDVLPNPATLTAIKNVITEEILGTEENPGSLRLLIQELNAGS